PPPPPLDKGGIGGVFENCILGPGFKIELNEWEIRGFSKKADAILIGTGGSDRKYYRVIRHGKSVVRMQCIHEDPDFQRHIEYTRFFQKYSIPVPRLREIEPDKMKVMFEDLGDLSLYSWLKCPREERQIEKIYRQVIDVAILIHTVATEHISECPFLQNRVFDYEHLRWETGYFIERFIEGIRNIRVKNPLALNEEFHRLALKVDSFPKTVIHRDFQSQNIMITKGIPRLVDYQGARIGPPAYDVVSILWDPYYRLESNMRERLLGYYISRIGERLGEKFSERDFRETLLPCRLQRHMQALGAYGFLSKIKGKKYFLKYMLEGARLLKEALSLSKDEYPELYALVMGL
ncbi:MAG: phosphotransferase, partial [Nitrospirae bacterium]|nr:phosphotransferase [Nitrospirota bacterium]